MITHPLMDSIAIREMRSDDLEQVRELDRLSFTMPWPDSAYNFEINENPLSYLWVAEDTSANEHGHIIGMIVTWHIMGEAHIATLAVHPDFRGRGIAKQLIITALEDAFTKGMGAATLEVRAHNEAARNLYQHFGFEVVGRRPRYYRDNNEDAIIMTLDSLDRSTLTHLAANID
jgi:ribosomal-protein-alanine N-acetyltransferase